MTKILNVDEIETDLDKAIVVGGVTYQMTPFSVEDFLDNMRQIESISQQELTGADLYERSLGMIIRAFPGLPEDVVKKLNTHQVEAIFQFMKAKTEEEAERIAEDVSPGNVMGEASS